MPNLEYEVNQLDKSLTHTLIIVNHISDEARELALVKTKVEEAKLWLDSYIDLVRRGN